MVVFENDLYIFGGIDANRVYLSTIHIYHVTSNAWEKITPSSNQVPYGRSLFAMFKSSKGIWINGGLSMNGKLGDMWFYNKI